jgi:phosphate transport system substrate-binding protein
VRRTSSRAARGIALAFPALIGACSNSPPPAPIRIDGSAGVAPIVTALVDGYRANHVSSQVELKSGLGSSARLKAVEDGQLEIAMASHGVDSADVARRGMEMRVIARTAVVFAVNGSVPVASLTSAQVCDVYRGAIRNWRKLGGPDAQIKALFRPAGEVDADVAIAGVACMRDLKPAADVQLLARPDEMASALASTDGAFGVTSGPMVEQSAGRIRAATLDGIVPSADNVANGRYPLSRDAILVYKAPVSPSVKQFLDFIASADGDRIIRANGAVSGHR